jgi:hypothetical protein
LGPLPYNNSVVAYILNMSHNIKIVPNIAAPDNTGAVISAAPQLTGPAAVDSVSVSSPGQNPG